MKKTLKNNLLLIILIFYNYYFVSINDSKLITNKYKSSNNYVVYIIISIIIISIIIFSIIIYYNSVDNIQLENNINNIQLENNLNIESKSIIQLENNINNIQLENNINDNLQEQEKEKQKFIKEYIKNNFDKKKNILDTIINNLSIETYLKNYLIDDSNANNFSKSSEVCTEIFFENVYKQYKKKQDIIIQDFINIKEIRDKFNRFINEKNIYIYLNKLKKNGNSQEIHNFIENEKIFLLLYNKVVDLYNKLMIETLTKFAVNIFENQHQKSETILTEENNQKYDEFVENFLEKLIILLKTKENEINKLNTFYQLIHKKLNNHNID
jgi:hypothetical protein